MNRDTSRKNITKLLHSLGAIVTGVADENEAALSSSGYNYTQPIKPTPPLQQPAAPMVSQGVNGGEIDCRTVAQYGMKSVNYYITADETALTAKDSSAWNIISHSKVKYTFDGLIAGQRYYIKVGLIGVRGQEVISEATSYIPQ